MDMAYYTFEALHADTHSGHNIAATVFVECGAFTSEKNALFAGTAGRVYGLEHLPAA